jgi:hypothetical protein
MFVVQLAAMRMRITRTVPPEYGAATESLLVGRVYNLDASLASALLLDGCAEVYDLLSPEERRERTEALTQDAWTPSGDRRPSWLRRTGLPTPRSET